MDDMPKYDHSVTFRIATDADLGIKSPEEIERQELALREYRAEMDAFRRSGENIHYDEAVRIRFHGGLDRVLAAVQAYEFPEDQPDESCNEFGSVSV